MYSVQARLQDVRARSRCSRCAAAPSHTTGRRHSRQAGRRPRSRRTWRNCAGCSRPARRPGCGRCRSTTAQGRGRNRRAGRAAAECLIRFMRRMWDPMPGSASRRCDRLHHVFELGTFIASARRQPQIFRDADPTISDSAILHQHHMQPSRPMRAQLQRLLDIGRSRWSGNEHHIPGHLADLRPQPVPRLLIRAYDRGRPQHDNLRLRQQVQRHRPLRTRSAASASRFPRCPRSRAAR